MINKCKKCHTVRIPSSSKFKHVCLWCGVVQVPKNLVIKEKVITNFSDMNPTAIEMWYITEFNKNK